MIINKEYAAMIFAAICELNSADEVIELIGGDTAERVAQVIQNMSDNTTPKQHLERAQGLLLTCCNVLLSGNTNDDRLPTRLEGSE